MILVDTSIWIDHLHRPEPALVSLLSSSRVAQHPMVIGELAMGSLRRREEFLGLLVNLPRVAVADNDEVRAFVDHHHLHGRGLGLVDAHLLAAVHLTPGTSLWTRDNRLRVAAAELHVAHVPAPSGANAGPGGSESSGSQAAQGSGIDRGPIRPRLESAGCLT
ncbi:MAG: type toxin-antitoxin system VapC family toxin [Subtercola sp.]|nr:type toxin-antitoxin system VapC family toxin [Subtercola sp.]